MTSGSNVVTQANIYGPSYNVDAVINGHQKTMLIDTGSIVSLLTEEFVKKHIGIDKMICADDLRLTSSLATASGDVLPCVGAVQVPVTFPEFELSLECTFLVIPSNAYTTSIMGINILEKINPGQVVKHKRLHQACMLIYQLNNKFGHVCTTSKKVKITANTVVFDTSTVKVPLAKFSRTVMIVPTPEAEAMHNLCFVSSCFVIPANVSTVDVPYRIGNIRSSHVVLQKNMHIYNIVSIDSACSVQSADDDPRNVSMLDKDFVSL